MVPEVIDGGENRVAGRGAPARPFGAVGGPYAAGGNSTRGARCTDNTSRSAHRHARPSRVPFSPGGEGRIYGRGARSRAAHATRGVPAWHRAWTTDAIAEWSCDAGEPGGRCRRNAVRRRAAMVRPDSKSRAPRERTHTRSVQYGPRRRGLRPQGPRVKS